MLKRVRSWTLTLSIAFICSLLLFLISTSGSSDYSQILKEEKTYPPNFPRPEEEEDNPLKYTVWDGSFSYSDTVDSPSEKIKPYVSRYTDAARAVADPHGKGSFEFGRFRRMPEGIEYDLQYRRSERETARITLFQPYDDIKVVHKNVFFTDTVVHIVMPLQGRLPALSNFLNNLINQVLPSDQAITLTIVYFRDNNYNDLVELVDSKLGPLTDFKWTLVTLNETTFSRGYGLQVGIENATSKPSDLVFFCDVDILMRPEFFTRCRSNTILGQQVYYPIVYSLYNPKLVYPLFDRTVPSLTEQLTVDGENGFWRNFGFGMACMYRGDLDAKGGFSKQTGWGGEDVTLYKSFYKYFSDIKINRAPDPSLFHVYHEKHCSDVPDRSYTSCLRSKAATEGSQLQLGMMLIKLHDGANLEGILSQRYNYFWLVPFLGGLLLLSLVVNLFIILVVCKFYYSHRKNHYINT